MEQNKYKKPEDSGDKYRRSLFHEMGIGGVKCESVWRGRRGGGAIGSISRRLSFSSDLVSGVNACVSVEQTRETREAFSRLQSR